MANKNSKAPNGSGSTYEYPKGSGRWIADVLAGHDSATGKPIRRKRRAKSQQEAVQFLQRLQREVEKGMHAHNGKVPTLQAFAHDWIMNDVQPDRAESTVRQYEYVLRVHVLPVLGKKKLDQVKRADVQALVNGLITKPKRAKRGTGSLSRRTVEMVKATLHNLFQDAVRASLASLNPCQTVKVPRERGVRKQKRALTPEQARKLIAALDGSPVREIVLFMLSTGTRSGEARGVRFEDIDFEAGTVHVCGQLQRVDGKLTRLNHTKSNQDRTLALPKDLLSKFRELQARRLIDGVGDPEGVVFLTPEGNRLDQKYLGNKLAEACERAGVPYPTVHGLRHTAATLHQAGTGDIHATQKLLGHSDVRLTSNLYAQTSQETARRSAEVLGKILFEK